MRISDWSSYVCSSDLEEQLQKLVIGAGERAHHRGVAPGNGRMEANIALAIRETAQRKLPDRASDALGDGVGHALVPGHRKQHPCHGTITIMSALEAARSEGRRVGKAGVSTCRYRWAPYH